MKFERFEKKEYIKQFVMVIFFSSAQSVYFNQFYCLMYICQLFLILDHTNSYVEKITLKIKVANTVPTGIKLPARTK